jgi:hypothetical protein
MSHRIKHLRLSEVFPAAEYPNRFSGFRSVKRKPLKPFGDLCCVSITQLKQG